MTVDFRERICQIDKLPSPPALAAELLGLTAKEDVKISDIAALIERDPALTARLLKLCNSAAFGLRHEVASVERAAVMLGIRQIKCLSLGFMILDNSDMNIPDGFDYEHYWRRASVTAVAARALAEKTNPILSGEAFVAGLVLDIGVLLLSSVEPDLYKSVLHTQERTNQQHPAAGARLHTIEESLFGIGHPEAGRILLEHWGLPEIVYVPVGVHHTPQSFDGDERVKALVNIVSVAGEIGNLFCEENKSENLERVMRICSAFFTLGEQEVHDLLTKVGDDARQAAWMFKIPQADALDYQKIQQVAEHELEQLAQQDP